MGSYSTVKRLFLGPLRYEGGGGGTGKIKFVTVTGECGGKFESKYYNFLDFVSVTLIVTASTRAEQFS